MSLTDSVCCSRLYMVQGALAQQEWRVAELLDRLESYLMSHLHHPYKNIRDRIGRLLTDTRTSVPRSNVKNVKM